MRADVAAATAAGAIIGLVSTIVMGVPDSLDVFDRERGRFGAMTAVERDQAFGTLIPTRMDIFDFYRRALRPDDRFYVQVDNGAFGTADKETVVRSVARYYLAPAVEVDRPEEATVILSYDTDPATLSLPYSEQIRAGLQLIFVSRVRR